MTISPCTAARLMSMGITASAFPFHMEVKPSLLFRIECDEWSENTDRYCLKTGVAYDTEKEFDSMFSADPYIDEYNTDWALVHLPLLIFFFRPCIATN